MTFRDRVYQITNLIPRGTVATYGQIARLAGHPKSARVVGQYMKTNPHAPKTPCHRVVSVDGSLTGYSAAGGTTTKKHLLLSEGVYFNGDKVDLVRSGWKS